VHRTADSRARARARERNQLPGRYVRASPRILTPPLARFYPRTTSETPRYRRAQHLPGINPRGSINRNAFGDDDNRELDADGRSLSCILRRRGYFGRTDHLIASELNTFARIFTSKEGNSIRNDARPSNIARYRYQDIALYEAKRGAGGESRKLFFHSNNAAISFFRRQDSGILFLGFGTRARRRLGRGRVRAPFFSHKRHPIKDYNGVIFCSFRAI